MNKKIYLFFRLQKALFDEAEHIKHKRTSPYMLFSGNQRSMGYVLDESDKVEYFRMNMMPGL